MHFGENQLSRSLIGLSPLTTGHPPTFQRWWVRPSTRSYPRFSLPMARSPRFGSRTRDYIRPIKTRFRYGYPTRVNLATCPNSQAHSSKGTPSPHPHKGDKALTDRRQTVSGTISLPSRGTFHHSLTVLSAIGHEVVFSLTRWSWQIHSRLQESAATRVPHPERPAAFAYRTITVYSSASQRIQLATSLVTSRPPVRTAQCGPTTPHTQTLTSITRTRFRLDPLSLATTHGITIVFFSYGY
jgi:hypothetical protein